MQNSVKYVFPENESLEDQFHFISTMMDNIEEGVFGELIFSIDLGVSGWHVEIYEHPDFEDEDNELVDWYHGKKLQDVFDYLMERYV